MARVGRDWTCVEVRILADVYPTGGAGACVRRLPRRSKSAIHAAAARQRIKRVGRKPGSGLRS